MGKNVWLDTSNDWTAGANWSLGSAPVTGDDVYILNGSQNITSNISGHSAVKLNSLTVGMGFTGTIGSVSGNTHNALVIGLQGSFNVTIGQPTQDGSAGAGSQRLIFDFGSDHMNLIGLGTANGSLDAGFAPCRIKGSSASNNANILAGRYGIGTVTGDTATLTTANVTGGVLIYGSGVTFTTVNVSGSGSWAGYATGTTLSVTAGATAVSYGVGKWTTVNVGGNVTLYNRDGTSTNGIATTANVYGTGTLDLSGNPASGTITTTNIYKGGIVKRNGNLPNNVSLNIQQVDSGILQAA